MVDYSFALDILSSDGWATLIQVGPSREMLRPGFMTDDVVNRPAGLFATFYAGLRCVSFKLMDSLEQLGGQLAALCPEKYIYDAPRFPKILAKDLMHHLVEQALQREPQLSPASMPGHLISTNRTVRTLWRRPSGRIVAERC